MRSLLTLAFVALLPTFAFAQGAKEPGPVKVITIKLNEPISYEKHVEPIFYKRCTVCHSGNVKEGKLDLSSHEALIKGGKSGEAIKPGKAEESAIYKAMARTGNAQMRPRPMPPKGDEPCTPEELALVKLWIDGGAKAPTSIRKTEKPKLAAPPKNVNPVRAVAISPDKATVAAGRSNQVHLYDAASGAHIRSLFGPNLKTFDGKDVKGAHVSIVESMAWSPDGKHLVTGSFQEIAIWDPLTGEQKHKITGFAHAVVAIQFSPDGKVFATAGGEPTVEGEVKVFEVGSWKMVFDLKNGHSDTVYGIAFSPEVKLPVPNEKDKFVSANLIATCSADKYIKVWNLADGKFVKSFEGHTHHVLDIGWSADGKKLASAGGDNTVKVWDFDKGEQERTINNAHTKQVTRLLFVGKKLEFLTASGDNSAKLFGVNGNVTRTFGGGTDFIYAVAASSDGSLVVTGGQEGIARVYVGTATTPTRSLLPPDAQPPMKTEEKKK